MQSDEVTKEQAGNTRHEQEQTKQTTIDLEEDLNAERSGAEDWETCDDDMLDDDDLPDDDDENSGGGSLYPCVWSFVRNYFILPLLRRPSRGDREEAEGVAGAPPRDAEAGALAPEDAGRDARRGALKNVPGDSGMFGYKAKVSRDPNIFRMQQIKRDLVEQKTVSLQTEDYATNEAAMETTDDHGPEEPANDTDEEYDKADAVSGMFSDGSRRTDLVLVLQKGTGEAGPQGEKHTVRNVLLNFLAGLIKLGLHIEVVAGVLPEHQDLEFAKLHAPDAVLKIYAEVFGVKKYFRESHEQFINNPRTLFGNIFGHKREREWIKIVRSQYEGPLRLSSLDRSYIVYQLLQHQTFGKPSNHYSLQRLLDNKIVVDAFALHDGPLRPAPGQRAITCRQILYFNWLSFTQIFKTQPLHLIYEYFGSKLALYFALYELVNKMLLVSSLWAAACSLLYWFKDKEYMQNIREYYCNNATLRDYKKMASKRSSEEGYRPLTTERSVVCAECEGVVNDTLVCPYTFMMDYCFDLHLMRFFDNPYVILYSFGIAFLALLLAFQWQRAESFWRWIWEETDTLLLARSRYQPRGEGCIALVYDVSVNILRTMVIEVLLPIFVVVSIASTLFVAFIYKYDWWRRMSTTKFLVTTQNGTKSWSISPPIVDRKKEYAVLMALAACVHVIFFAAEKLCHWISYWSTRAENHRSHEQFDESLSNKYFTFSFVYSSSLVIYFAWIKAAFYYTPLSSWDLILNLTTPWRFYSVNLSAALPPRWFSLLRLAATMNCGPYSCIRQGFAVFLVTLGFRVVLVSLVTLLWRWGQTCLAESRDKSYNKPSVEREYQLKRVASQQIAGDLNTLVVHFSLVILFAPLIPLAPLVMLLINVCDLRSKARMYLVSRRAVLQRVGTARGAGRARVGRGGVLPTAGDILRLVCYAVPLFHGLCIARMEVLKRYVYHTWARGGHNSSDPDLFKDFLHKYNIMFLNVSQTHQRFFSLNYFRIYEKKLKQEVQESATPTDGLIYYVDCSFFRGEQCENNFLYGLSVCRVNGFFKNSLGDTSAVWPRQAPAMHENVTNTAPMAEHYELLFYKALFLLLYTVAFAVLAACLWECGAGRSRGVCARAAREATLRRIRLGEQGPLSLRLATRPRPARDAPSAPHSPRK